MELLQFLKFDRRAIAAVGFVSFKDTNLKTRDFVGKSGRTEVQLLRPTEGGSAMIFIKWRPKQGSLLSEHIETGRGYIIGPFAFRDGRFRITLLGNQKQIQEFLERAEERDLSYKVVSAMDARFWSDSPLGSLTERQRDVLISAFKLGYYDIPRKLDSDELANRLNLANSTVVEHIRKAERRMLAEIVGRAISH